MAVLRAEAPAGLQAAQAPLSAEVRQLRRLLILEEAAMESDIRRCAHAPRSVRKWTRCPEIAVAGETKLGIISTVRGSGSRIGIYSRLCARAWTCSIKDSYAGCMPHAAMRASALLF